MSILRTAALLGATLLAATAAQASCYTVMNTRGDILSQTSTPPVNMAYQLHQTVPERFGADARLLFGVDEPDCGPLADPYSGGAMPASAARQIGAPKRRSHRTPQAKRS